jgi:hypothetical protein
MNDKDYIEIEGIKIYREDILRWEDYYLHNSGNISYDSEQLLGNIIISNIINQNKDE